MSTNQRERLAEESQDKCEARLERMSTNQRERLARESQDEQEDRLWMINSCRNELYIESNEKIDFKVTGRGI